MSERVIVFDTTLRDGEQAAGVCFSRRDKLEIAERLAAMRVDVIEAGFPAASPGELAAVAAVARQVDGASVCALARAVAGDVDAAGHALRGARRPRIHVFVNSSDVHLAQQLRKSREDVLQMARAARGPRASLHGRRRVQPDGRDALRSGLPGRDRAGRARCGRHHDQRARHGRLHPAGSARGAAARAARARAAARGGRALVPRAGRSGARDRQLPGGGRAPACARSSSP